MTQAVSAPNSSGVISALTNPENAKYALLAASVVVGIITDLVIRAIGYLIASSGKEQSPTALAPQDVKVITSNHTPPAAAAAEARLAASHKREAEKMQDGICDLALEKLAAEGQIEQYELMIEGLERKLFQLQQALQQVTIESLGLAGEVVSTAQLLELFASSNKQAAIMIEERNAEIEKLQAEIKELKRTFDALKRNPPTDDFEARFHGIASAEVIGMQVARLLGRSEGAPQQDHHASFETRTPSFEVDHAHGLARASFDSDGNSSTRSSSPQEEVDGSLFSLRASPITLPTDTTPRLDRRGQGSTDSSSGSDSSSFGLGVAAGDSLLAGTPATGLFDE
ncbi:hypothetical protein K0U07_00175 [bacterium]|nr:hypothetical protein [bacterium]